MQIYNHLNITDQKYLQGLNENSPFQFLPGFTMFHKHYEENTLNILYSEKLNAFIPVRFFSSKLFTLAQILHAPICDNQELNTDEQLIFFDELISFVRKKNLAERFIQPHPFGILAATPNHARACEFGTYVNNLSGQTEEEIFSNFNPKYQKAIRHSEKNGATVKFGKEVLNDFYACYSSTMQRVGMTSEKFKYFEAQYKYMTEKYVTCGVVYENNIPIGGIFMIHSNYAALCTHAGSMGDSKLYGAIKMLHWEMMKRLKSQGVKKYDLVGVRIGNNDPTLEGIFRFKKGFGGELKTGFLWKIDIKPIRSRMYDLLSKIKNPDPKYKDIIDQVNPAGQ
jgi:hypothetical protein